MSTAIGPTRSTDRSIKSAALVLDWLHDRSTSTVSDSTRFNEIVVWVLLLYCSSMQFAVSYYRYLHCHCQELRLYSPSREAWHEASVVSSFKKPSAPTARSPDLAQKLRQGRNWRSSGDGKAMTCVKNFSARTYFWCCTREWARRVKKIFKDLETNWVVDYNITWPIPLYSEI